jgi:hypothetical protein
MDSLKIIIETFEKFIKRSLMPSSSFLLLLILYDTIINEKESILKIFENNTSTITIVIFFISFFGLSTILTIIHQAVYDNSLKNNFNGFIGFSIENRYLEKLRKEVQDSLDKPESTDYLLYQQIKATLRDIDTSRYVDDAKTIGISFVSILIMFGFAIYNKNLSPFYILGMIVIYLIGRELVKSKYRSRAIHLYTNYLAK